MLNKIKSNGLVLMLLSTAAFSIASVFVKISSDSYKIPVMEIVFFRSLINTVLIIAIARIRNDSILGKNHGLLLTRSMLGFISLVAFFQALSMIKYANAVILSYTSPVFAVIFSVFLLKEKVNLALVAKIIVALTGAVMVVKPSLDMFNRGGLYAVCSALFAACAYISVRKLSKDNNWETIIFYFTGLSTVLSIPFIVNNFVVPRSYALLSLLFVGIFSSVGQIFMTKAYQFLPASRGTLISLFSIVISMFISYFVFAEALGLYTIIGGILIFSGAGGVAILRPILFHRHPNRNF